MTTPKVSANQDQPESQDAHAESNTVRSWLWGPFSRLGAITAILTCALDQAHKWAMIAGYGIKEGDRFQLFPFFDIVFIKNTGVSYSLFDNSSYTWQLALAAFSTIVASALWSWLSKSATSSLMALSLGLIIGGAIGNAIDRITLGGVADFFLLHAQGRSWYVFNVADIAIVAGVIGLLYDSLVSSRNDASKAS